MGYVSCPTDVVHAPIGIVWSLLTDPAGWGDFFDVRAIAVNPPGSTLVGQTVHAESGPRWLSRFLPLGLRFECTDIDATRHRLGLDVHLPFGIKVREDLECMALDGTTCRVNYHCDFRLPAGWRGAILRLVMRRELDLGPIDSLSRLKRAAERRYAGLQQAAGPRTSD
jgi:hypothetical protein